MYTHLVGTLILTFFFSGQTFAVHPKDGVCPGGMILSTCPDQVCNLTCAAALEQVVCPANCDEPLESAECVCDNGGLYDPHGKGCVADASQCLPASVYDYKKNKVLVKCKPKEELLYLSPCDERCDKSDTRPCSEKKSFCCYCNPANSCRENGVCVAQPPVFIE